MGQVFYKGLVFLPPESSYAAGQVIFGVPVTEVARESGPPMPFALVRPEGGYLRDHCLLYSHGNAEDLGQTVPLLVRLAEEFGISAACYDYQGYGPSRGAAQPNEDRCYRDARTAYEHLCVAEGFERRKVVLFGRSLGSGPTVELARALSQGAGEEHRFAGVVLQSPLTSAVSVVSETLSAMVGDMFENLRKLPSVRRPVLIVHGTEDRVVPLAHGQQLANALRVADAHLDEPRRRLFHFQQIDGAGHNDIEALHWIGLRDALSAFFQHLKTHEAAEADLADFWIGATPSSSSFLASLFSSPASSSSSSTTAPRSPRSTVPSSSATSEILPPPSPERK